MDGRSIGTQVLIVGAGHTGLVAAIYAGGRGLEVTVLEGGGARRRDRVGGGHAPRLRPRPLRRVRADARSAPRCASSSSTSSSVDPPVVMAHPFDDGSAIALHRDLAATAASLGPAGAGGRRRWSGCCPSRSALAAAIFAPLPPARAALGSRWRCGRHAALGAAAARAGGSAGP